MLKPPPETIQRIVYMGTPAMAVPPLAALHEAGFDIALVVSAPDKRRGRGNELSPTPVKAKAIELGLPVSESIYDALEVDADLAVVVAFGQLIKPDVLERLAMVNLHFSLLPRWRGAAPVERAILEGDSVTGAGVMQLDVGLDTGDIYAEAEVSIGDDQTADELRVELVEVGSKLLVDTLRAGLSNPRPQITDDSPVDPVYARKIFTDDLRLDFERPAVELHRMVRVGNAWTTFRGKRFKVWQTRVVDDARALPAGSVEVRDGKVLAGTGEGALELVIVQPEGKARQDAKAWSNGAQPTADERFGT